MKAEYEERIVSFVDILGFSDDVNKSNDGNLTSILRQIECFRDSFSENPKDIIKEDDVYFLSFSDGLIRARKIIFSPLFFEIIAYAHGIANIVSNGYFIRGAITHGNFYVNEDKNILVSPAFVRAYQLESNIAINPRVIVDPITLEALKNRKDFWLYDTDEEYTTANIYDCLRLDNDGYYFIDYLKVMFSEVEEENEYFVFVEKHKVNIIEKLGSAHDASIRKKYIWLGNYHNQVVSEFGGWLNDLKIPDELLVSSFGLK